MAIQQQQRGVSRAPRTENESASIRSPRYSTRRAIGFRSPLEDFFAPQPPIGGAGIPEAPVPVAPPFVPTMGDGGGDGPTGTDVGMADFGQPDFADPDAGTVGPTSGPTTGKGVSVGFGLGAAVGGLPGAILGALLGNYVEGRVNAPPAPPGPEPEPLGYTEEQLGIIGQQPDPLGYTEEQLGQLASMQPPEPPGPEQLGGPPPGEPAGPSPTSGGSETDPGDPGASASPGDTGPGGGPGGSTGSEGETGGGGTAGGDSNGGDSDGGDAGFARGGFVTPDRLAGANPPGPDDGFAALDAGEFVVNAGAAQQNAPLLQSINAGMGMQPDPAMIEDLGEQLEPALAASIMQRADAQQLIATIKSSYIDPAIRAIQEGRHAAALQLYAEMVTFITPFAIEAMSGQADTLGVSRPTMAAASAPGGSMPAFGPGTMDAGGPPIAQFSRPPMAAQPRRY